MAGRLSHNFLGFGATSKPVAPGLGANDEVKEEVRLLRVAQEAAAYELAHLSEQIEHTHHILESMQEDFLQARRVISGFPESPPMSSQVTTPSRPRSKSVTRLDGMIGGSASVHANTVSERTHNLAATASAAALGAPIAASEAGDSGSRQLEDFQFRGRVGSACRDGPLPVTYLTATFLNVSPPYSAAPSGRWLLHPTSRVSMALNALVLAVLLVDLTATPYILAFEENDAAVDIFLALVIFWTVFTLTNFRRGFLSTGGELEMDPGAIALHYLKTWLMLDLVPLICDWVAVILNEVWMTDGSETRPRFIGYLHITTILRAPRAVNMVTNLWERSLSPQVKMFIEGFGLFFALFWVNHVLSCGFCATGFSRYSDTGLHWIDALIDSTVTKRYRDEDDKYIYLSGLHWSVTQMTPGSMQVNPRNSAERCFVIICLGIGMVMQASIISGLSSKILHWRIRTLDKHQRIGTLRRFLQERQVHPDIALRVQRQVMERMTSTKPLTPEDIPALKILPDLLKAELMDGVCRCHVIRFPFFRLIELLDEGGKLIHDICSSAVEFAVFQAGDTAFVADAYAESMYLFLSGSMTYRTGTELRQTVSTVRGSASASPASVRNPVEEGVLRGSSGLVESRDLEKIPPGTCLAEAALWVSWNHVGTAECTANCELLNVSSVMFWQFVKRHPNILVITKEYRFHFHHQLLAGREDANDLAVPNCDYGGIVLCMSTPCRVSISLAALSVLSSVRSRRMGLATVEEEVRSGRCTLVLSCDDNLREDVVRMLAVTVLRVHDKHGNILVKLGNVVHGKVEQTVKLPGAKQEDGETPYEALQRVLKTEHAALAGMQIQRVEKEAVVKTSAKTGIKSLYLKTIFLAQLGPGFAQPDAIPPGTGSRHPMQHSCSKESNNTYNTSSWQHLTSMRPWGALMPKGIMVSKSTSSRKFFCDVFPMKDASSDRISLCAWLTPDDCTWVTTTSEGEQAVDEFLKAMVFEIPEHAPVHRPTFVGIGSSTPLTPLRMPSDVSSTTALADGVLVDGLVTVDSPDINDKSLTPLRNSAHSSQPGLQNQCIIFST